MQDPIELIGKFLEKYQEGYDVVVAKRVNRPGDSKLKKILAKYFYKFYNRISKINISENAGDFRLMRSKVVANIRLLPENTVFMRGILSWVGFKTCFVDFERPIRSSGITKYNTWKSWNYALDGVTSFSTFPLRIWSYFGSFVPVLSFIYILYIAIDRIIGNPFSGYASLMAAILFFGGIQLISIGILGEYIGRIFLESKRRPKYIIKDIINL